MTPPQPPYGQPQQSGQQPGYYQQGYPQQQPGYPQQPAYSQPQAGFPQQPHTPPGYPQIVEPRPKAAYAAAAVSAVAALISLIFAIGYIDDAIGMMGGITGETNAGVGDALFWVTSATGLLTALGIAATAVLLFLRQPFAPLLGMVSGGLGVIMMGFRVATAFHADANRGSSIEAADVEYITVLALAIVVLVVTALPPVKAALNPKPAKAGHPGGPPMQFPAQGYPPQVGYPQQGFQKQQGNPQQPGGFYPQQ
ncbi:hypothetical protein [Saccharopolyspora sp. NPDC049426]|uniref:hypothetical protein n=1 Tax=Saccharopolyspora sp. NPDC049426 TaxID=3155652 RepID=UPI003417C1EB